MKRKGLIILMVFLGLIFNACAQGAEMPAAPTVYLINLNSVPTPSFLERLNADNNIYENCPISKAGDGALNAALAWVDIPKGISEETEDSNLFLGLTIGLGKGLIVGVKREAAGIIDLATCGFPPYDKPLMTPDYKVNQPDKNGFKVKVWSW
ncbi:MAG: exosortase system-associated protein, TIGR04073 family [Candidatus Omnitrophota bacterium]|nr:exosortase system-associated protein, TIGR04073 family [Candidatus Omnitrophota bacterium]